MGDMGDFYRDVKDHRRLRRERLGIPCPKCREVRPKAQQAQPTILLPGHKCKVDGYVDPRPRERGE